MDFLDKYASQITGITRIVIGLLFLEHGTVKVLSFPVGPAGIIELVGGALIVLGLFSRWACFIASGEMAFAFFLAHFPRSPFPILNGGGEAVAFCFIFLLLAAIGPGAFAINKK